MSIIACLTDCEHGLTYPYTAWAVTTYWPIYVSQSSGRESVANDGLNNKTSGHR